MTGDHRAIQRLTWQAGRGERNNLLRDMGDGTFDGTFAVKAFAKLARWGGVGFDVASATSTSRPSSACSSRRAAASAASPSTK